MGKLPCTFVEYGFAILYGFWRQGGINGNDVGYSGTGRQKQ